MMNILNINSYEMDLHIIFPSSILYLTEGKNQYITFSNGEKAMIFERFDKISKKNNKQ